MDNKSKLDIHASLCDQLKEVYKTKNADYGDSFASVRNKIGNTAILVRLMDKQSRLETLLLGSHQQVKDESIDDTLMDLANYCLLELTERIADKQKAENNTTSTTTSYEEVIIKCKQCYHNYQKEIEPCIKCTFSSNFKALPDEERSCFTCDNDSKLDKQQTCYECSLFSNWKAIVTSKYERLPERNVIHENNPTITKPQVFIRSGYEPHEPDQRE